MPGTVHRTIRARPPPKGRPARAQTRKHIMTTHTTTPIEAGTAPAAKPFDYGLPEVLTAAARVLLPFVVMAGILLLAR